MDGVRRKKRVGEGRLCGSRRDCMPSSQCDVAISWRALRWQGRGARKVGIRVGLHELEEELWF